MKVLKFGGTSVGTPEAILQAIKLIEQAEKQVPVIIVVSAFSGVTNTLLSLGEVASTGDKSYEEELYDLEKRVVESIQQTIPIAVQTDVLVSTKILLNDLEDLLQGIYLIRELSPQTKDLLLSFGERISVQVIHKILSSRGHRSALLHSNELIVTNSRFGKAVLNKQETNKRIKEAIDQSPSGIFIAAGFIASNEEGIMTTLGRGGSDYSAAIYASAVDAYALEIWTDVDGVMTADPNKVKKTYTINKMSYTEAMELSHFGAKIIYAPTIEPVCAKNIPLYIKNTFNPDFQGTVIGSDLERDKRDKDSLNSLIRGISYIEDIVVVNVKGSGMIGVPGIAKRLFETLSVRSINIILITQASSEHNITFSIVKDDLSEALEALEHEFSLERETGQIQAFEVKEDMAILAIVGEHMMDKVNVAGRMFSILGRNGISIVAIAQGSSESNISVVIHKRHARKALNALHETYFSLEKKIHLYLAGLGNVGKVLLKQIHQQTKQLAQNYQIEISVCGVINTKKMLVSEDGLDQSQIFKLLQKGEKADIDKFVKRIRELNLRNSVFVDCTASKHIAGLYLDLISSSIGVVAANKIACSSDMEYYRQLKKKSLRNNTPFFFETNVGAGLPVINTLGDLLKSGDHIISIEGILSGTLNYLFNHLSKDKSFSSVLRDAKAKGYTEPDPREDLSGYDVVRKILILSREAGTDLEMEDVALKAFMPNECMQADNVDSFMNILPAYDTHFEEVLAKAEAKDKKLRYIARYKDNKITASLEEIDSSHPFYHLEGQDNMLLFYTKRYPTYPLVIRGAGAGAEVTASGVFADVIRTISN